jgi:ankyrin repeat protein
MGCFASKSVAQQAHAPETAPPAQSTTTAPVDDQPKNDGPHEINQKLIHSSVRWNKPVDVVEALLVNADAVNCEDPGNGNRPVHIAAQNGHDDLIQLLIRKKADINAKNGKGNTALHMAIGYDYYDAAKHLIQAGASLDDVNESGVAARYGLEGDKCLGIALLCKATTPEEVSEAFDLCDSEIEHLHKINFAQSGLKAKKVLGDSWSKDLQERFKGITNKIN